MNTPLKPQLHKHSVSGSALSSGNLVHIENELIVETKNQLYKVSGVQMRNENYFPDSDLVIGLDHVGSIRTYNQFNQFVKPILITEDWMQKFKQIRKTAKNKWFISLAHLKSEIHIELFRGCFVFSIQNDMGIFWLPDYKFIHEIQNLCKSLNVELSLS